jgi:quinol monooxygenase YgiN
MPVLEVTQLRLKGVTAGDAALLDCLSQVRGDLQTNSRFFGCDEDPNLIYIFGIWKSLDAHFEFLASPACSEVLKPQEEILSFQWTVHLEWSSVSSSLLDASYVAIEKIDIDAANIHRFNEAIDRRVQALRSTNSLNITYGWRCDLPPGSYQAVLLTSSGPDGSRDIEAIEKLVIAGNDGCTSVLLHHVWNMEHIPLKLKADQ